MKILFVSAEVAPFVNVGGLSQVSYFLPRALAGKGHDVRVFTPRYGSMAANGPDGEPWEIETVVSELRVPVEHDNGFVDKNEGQAAADLERSRTALEHGGGAGGDKSDAAAGAELVCQVQEVRQGNGAPAYLLVNKEYFELRANVFGYADDHTRFALLSKGCLEWLLSQHAAIQKGEDDAWWPDVIHCHDWHSSYLIDLGRRDKRYRKVMAGVPLLLTVHNFKYQGNGDFRFVPEAERDNGLSPLAPLLSDDLRRQNALKRGLMFADAVTTVSQTHAVEVLTPEYAEGLEETLQRIRGRMTGILNGIDTREFDPSSDPVIHRRYSRRWFSRARAENKKFLQKTFSLPEDPAKTIVAYVGRLTAQKGWELLLPVLPPLLEEREDLQFVALGSGEEKFRNELMAIQQKFPGKVGLHLQADFRLPRHIFSGADVVLIPSIFEPGGIVAMEALRYGAIPLVRRTGGLNDSIRDFDPVARTGNGFSFRHKNSWALYGAIIEALTLCRQPALRDKLVSNCLASDFSWRHAASEYAEWYERAVQDRRRRNERRSYAVTGEY